MKFPSSPPSNAHRWLVAGMIGLMSLSTGFAQEAVQTASSGTEQSLQILDQQVIDYGSHTVTLNLIQTPPLKPMLAPEPSSVVAVALQPSAEELKRIQEWNSKEEVILFLSCTVFDHQVTEIRWRQDDGEYVIWSSIDFNLLRGLFDFETSDKRYTVFLGVGDTTREEVEAANAEILQKGLPSWMIQQLPVLSVTSTASFKIVAAPQTGISPAATAAMDALHRYFDANRDRLVKEYQESEAARIAKEQWDKEHPPVPKDITVHYFPIRSSYNAGQTEGGAK